MFFFFFFQAEDGIRDLIVTGVQTCALPILRGRPARRGLRGFFRIAGRKELHGRNVAKDSRRAGSARQREFEFFRAHARDSSKVRPRFTFWAIVVGRLPGKGRQSAPLTFSSNSGLDSPQR